MLTYMVEPWSSAWPDLVPMWQAHWEEVATHKDKIELAVDFDAYARMEAAGQLNVLVVRDAGVAVGYHISFIRPHFHYRNSLTAYTDVYYLDPKYRLSTAGVKLFTEAEKSLKARGVQRMFTGTKLSHDKGRIFEHLGWTETERTFTKYIGD